jgi:hypothetical protein
MRGRSVLLLIVGGAAALSVGALYAIRALVPAALLAANNEVAGNYLQTLGTVYAVLLAFVVFVVWSQHNDARSAVEREANEISDLDRTVQGLPDPTRGEVHARLRAYVAAVVDQEWAAMARSEASPQAVAQLEGTWHALARLDPSSPREEALFNEALARFNDLSDCRNHRLISCRLRLPPMMWLLLITGAVLTVGSMFFFGLPSFCAHAMMTAALAGLITFMLFVILDLDNPFWGDWRVTPEPIRRAVPDEAR